MTQPMTPAQSRARHLERLAEQRLDLWRLRGQVAARTRAPRQAPLIPSKDSATVAARSAAWLAGYDSAARATA